MCKHNKPILFTKHSYKANITNANNNYEGDELWTFFSFFGALKLLL